MSERNSGMKCSQAEEIPPKTEGLAGLGVGDVCSGCMCTGWVCAGEHIHACVFVCRVRTGHGNLEKSWNLKRRKAMES